MTADPYLSSMTRGAMSSAYQALRATQADVANARARGPAAAAPAQSGYPPSDQMSPEMMWMMQQQQMMMMQMYAQNQAMMNMVMMMMSGGLQNQGSGYWNQIPSYATFITPDQLAQINQLPQDQQDEVQQLMTNMLFKLQIAMSQINAFTGQGNTNTVFNTDLGMIRADMSAEAIAALVSLKTEVGKVSMSSAKINEAAKNALQNGANLDDIFRAIRGGYNKDDQLPLSRFYAAMTQPTRTADGQLVELYSALYQKAALADTPDDLGSIFEV